MKNNRVVVPRESTIKKQAERLASVRSAKSDPETLWCCYYLTYCNLFMIAPYGTAFPGEVVGISADPHFAADARNEIAEIAARMNAYKAAMEKEWYHE